jgi:hypothetical protein
MTGLFGAAGSVVMVPGPQFTGQAQNSLIQNTNFINLEQAIHYFTFCFISFHF